MLNFWLHNLILWICRLIGIINSFLRRAVILNLMILMAIGGGLWLADRLVSTRSILPAETEKPAASAVDQEGVRPSEPSQPTAGNAGAATPEIREAERTEKKVSPANSSKAEAPRQGKGAGEQVVRKPWFTFWNVLSIWAFGLITWWVVRGRRRLVVSKFEDHSDNKAGINAGGFGVLVATELAGLSDLFSEFESGRSIQSIPDKLEPIDAAFQTESAGAFLQDTISAETKFSLGPLEVPVGIILNLVGQLVQGPRLTGQLHHDGQHRIITLRLTGSRVNRSWIVTDQALTFQADKETWRMAAEVAHQLACRLFVELAMSRSVTWEALSQFVAGVRAYRRSMQTPNQRKLNRKEAEHMLIQALVEDPGFDLAYYNLGVVYLELGKPETARAAFALAMEKNNQRKGTYYALALVDNLLAQQAFKRNQDEAAKLHHSRALDLCDQALDLSPPPAEAANILSLKALVHWWRGFRMWAGQPTIQTLEFKSSGVMARRAVRKAWQELCLVELGFGMSARKKASALAQARSMASRQLDIWANILLEVARLQALQVPGPKAIKAARDAAEARKAVREGPKKAGTILTGLQSWKQERGLRAVKAKTLFRLSLWLLEMSLWFQKGFLWTDEMNYTTEKSNIIRKISLRKATYVLRQARMFTPGETSVHINLGKTYLERRRYRDAIGSLRTATRLAPGSSEPWGFLALACARLGRRGEVDEASKRLLANVWGASQASQEALENAMVTLKELFQQIEEFAAMIPKDEQMLREPFFRRWSRRNRLWFRRRLAGHNRKHFKEAEKEFDRLLAEPEALSGIIVGYENARKRVADLRRLDGEIREMSMKGEEGIAQLKELFEEKKSLGHDWETGEIGQILADLYRKQGQLPEGEDYLRRTIAHLEKTIHREIQRRGLHILLAQILRERHEYPAALEQAKLGVARDPMNPKGRVELGWVYWYLAEYTSAQSAWEDALILAPQYPELHVNLGLVHLRQMEDERDRAARVDRIASAVRHLQTALALYEDDDPARNGARLLLFRAFDAAGRYTEALRELRALERSDYCKLAVAIYVANEYLKKDDWTEAERRFRKIAAEVDTRIQTAKDGPNETVETPLGDIDMLLGTVSAYAHLGTACSLAEREIFLDRALAEVTRAREALKGLKREDLKEYWAGRCTFFEGVILTKQDQCEEAIIKLETALAEHADAATYLALANALARKFELIDEADVKTKIIRRAAVYYQEAQRLDWNGELEGKINKALERLQPVVTN